MKILHVIPRLSFTGGIENYVRTLCLHPFQDGYEITICTFLNRSSTEIMEELLNKGIKIVPLKKSWFEKVDNRFLRFFLKNSFFAYFNKLLYLKKIINNEKHNLVIAHGEDAELIAAFTPPSVKKVNVIHGDSYFPANPFYRFLLYSFARKRYDFTIVVNERLKIIPEKLGVKYAIVKPGINLERFNTAKHQIDLQDGSVKIGFIGRVVKEKGVFELLEAYNILKQKHRKIQLKIAGDGKALVPLQKKVKEFGLTNDIKFYGEVSAPALFYREIDILVLPSFTEGLPITILEAMASGVIVIASNVGGILEIIKNKQNGLLLESCKPDVIVNAVENLINNPVLCNEIVNNANETIKDYSDKKLVEEFYSTVNTIIRY
jgi:glycosyltransferase involved in cell wall biosynthesis